jgi:hypothetical protein
MELSDTPLVGGRGQPKKANVQILYLVHQAFQPNN